MVPVGDGAPLCARGEIRPQPRFLRRAGAHVDIAIQRNDVHAAVTVRADVPVPVSAVAAMLAVPAVTPLTIPLHVTVATAVLFDAQATVRPVSVLPFASLRVAVSWTVWPVGTEAGAGVTVTEA